MYRHRKKKYFSNITSFVLCDLLVSGANDYVFQLYLNFSSGKVIHFMKGYSVTMGQRVVERRINQMVSSLN